MNRNRLILTAVLLVALRPPALAQEWYVSYGKGLEAFRRQQWQEAVSAMSDAIGEKSDSKAKARYGMQFIDYFPYVYRGVAYFKLNDREKSRADLEKAEGEGVVGNAGDDETAPRLLREYLELVRKKNVPAVPQPDARYVEGMRLYNKKDFVAAAEKLKDVPASAREYSDAQKYADLARREAKKADAAGTAKDRKEQIDRSFAAGVRDFKDGALDQAESEFRTVLRLDGTRADARRYIARIRTRRDQLAAASRRPAQQAEIPARQPATETSKPPADTSAGPLFREAVALFSGGKISLARGKFEELRRTEPDNAEARRYLLLIEETSRRTKKGIGAFFEGEYQTAIDQLDESAKNESDNPHLYAFLACSYAARYLLAGEEDVRLRDNALAAYGKVKSVDAGYALDRKLISPRILSILGAP